MPHDRATRRRLHRSGLRWTIGVNALLLGTVLLFPSAALAGSVERFIQDFNRRLSSELGRLDLSDGERRLRFAHLLDDYVDLGAASALMLGPRWARASAQDQARFCAALRDYLVDGFAARVHGFGHRRLRITELLWDGPVVTVVSELSSDYAVTIMLEWQITRGGPVGWRLFNVTVAGMNMAAIMRAQLSAAELLGKDARSPLTQHRLPPEAGLGPLYKF
ncbi:MAG: MlaC protein [Rhodospirillales bacterium]|nr:MlaC protein [Rhodospirillales bacterium]